MREFYIYYTQFASLGDDAFPINVNVAATTSQQAIDLASFYLKGKHGPLLSLKRTSHIIVPGIA